METCRTASVWACLLICAASQGIAFEQEEPKLLAVYPSAARRGQILRVELSGNRLEGAASVWVASPGVSGKVTGAGRTAAQNPSERETKQPPLLVVPAEIQVDNDARSGTYWLRTVSARGVSNAVRFDVVDGAVVTERETAHAEAWPAQRVDLPSMVTGRLSKPGETDLFSFDAQEGERLSFEVTAAENFDPRVALFGDKKSWFDEARPVRLLFDEEVSFDLMPVQARGTFRAPRRGRYFVEVSSLFGKGCGECTYQMAMRRSEAAPPGAPSESGAWKERSFARVLTPEWLRRLEERASHARASGREVSQYSDEEPGREIRLPALISGTIGKPGEIDTFRVPAKSGDKLAFEIETPGTRPPHFNPVLAVIDPAGQQIFSNIQRRVSLFNNNAEVEGYLKDIEPKAVHTFPHDGAYTLKVRDLTSRYGGDSYAYRIVARKQIPHVGEVTSPELDRINLHPGASRKVTLTAALEEGFSGDVAYSVDGLPPGVTVYAGGRLIEERAPRDLPENAETVLPGQYTSTLIFAAASDAKLSTEPSRAVLRFRPIVSGKAGSERTVREFPIMVMERPKPEEAHK